MKNYLIFGIFLYIMQNKKVTTKELAENFEVSTRTIYRYIDDLSFAGVPIVTTQGRFASISILDNFNIKSCPIFKK